MSGDLYVVRDFRRREWVVRQRFSNGGSMIVSRHRWRFVAKRRARWG